MTTFSRSSHAFIVQTVQTAPGASAVHDTTTPTSNQTSYIATGLYADYETNAWTVDTIAGAMEIWWTNPDSSAIQLHIGYTATGDGGSYVAAASLPAFTAVNGPATYLASVASERGIALSFANDCRQCSSLHP